MDRVDGKTAFITGGARGIGLGIARAFARAGVKLAIGGYRSSLAGRGESRTLDRNHGGDLHPRCARPLGLTRGSPTKRNLDSARSQFCATTPASPEGSTSRA